ncbi:MAG: ATP-dependent helicase HrpB [Acidobacteria bacterium]|nr:ATP-dependent helicase HrpB [Acidobacteriota bacterium]
MVSLPVDALLDELRASIHKHSCAVLEAPPGAGKTTRVPPAMLAETRGEVWVLEPRRLAARLAARRVAEEMGERAGETVGYQVRFEEVAGPRTRLRFLTEGVLTRKLLTDPELRAAGIVILDEFHERHLDGDLALAFLLDLRRTRRKDLKLIVMSATLDAAPIAAHLGNAPILRSEGKLHPIAIEWTPETGATLEDRVANGVERLARQGLTGDILVFLPGAFEMRRAGRSLERVAEAHNLIVTQLHGDLSPDEQDRALAPAARPKVILSTNVAESSVTIEGVTAVVDSGLARVAIDSPWTGIPTLQVARVSRASAAQRAGRAGRTAPGRVIRLYTQEEYVRRPAQDPPEIERRELTQLLLELHGGGVADAMSLPWLTPPPAAALSAAEALLGRLGAVESGRLTKLGRRMAQLPLHPRLARLVLEAEERGAGEEGARAAAALSAGERLEGAPRHHADSDLFLLLEQRWQPHTARMVEQIRRAARLTTRRTGNDTGLLIAIVAAFSDRLGRKRGNGEILLAGGGAAQLADSSGVRDADLLVALDIEYRKDRGQPLIRIASKVDPNWLLDLFPERMDWRDGVEWNRVAERVESISALTFDGFAIEESRSGAVDMGKAAHLLAERAVEAGLARFAGAEELEDLLSRWRFAAAYGGPPVPDAEVQIQALETACYGRKSFAELRELLGAGGLERVLLDNLQSGQRDLLDRLAPERIRLPGGRQTKVRYVDGQPPSVASRLQDFFGMKETPRVAGGRVNVVVQLLAPNHRPVQMTQDLAGFWERLYPQLRKELGRRYPRHAWPENPLA